MRTVVSIAEAVLEPLVPGRNLGLEPAEDGLPPSEASASASTSAARLLIGIGCVRDIGVDEGEGGVSERVTMEAFDRARSPESHATGSAPPPFSPLSLGQPRQQS